MEAYLAISVMGPDRPGIVDQVSRLVADAGGNIEDSRMAVLGGEFALIMLISVPAGAAEEAASGIRGWAGASGMTATVKPTSGPARGGGQGAAIGVEMPDRPGIVSRVTHFLAERGANVETLETEVRRAPFSGAPVFSMHIDIRAAGKIPLEQLRSALQDLADDEDIHITMGTSL
jgi:glycine cleavage system transcriptional repressor